jgi:hypothetical protein
MRPSCAGLDTPGIDEVRDGLDCAIRGVVGSAVIIPGRAACVGAESTARNCIVRSVAGPLAKPGEEPENPGVEGSSIGPDGVVTLGGSTNVAFGNTSRGMLAAMRRRPVIENPSLDTA